MMNIFITLTLTNHTSSPCNLYSLKFCILKLDGRSDAHTHTHTFHISSVLKARHIRTLFTSVVYVHMCECGMDVCCENGIGHENCVCFICHKNERKRNSCMPFTSATFARSSYQCRQTFIAYTSSHSLTEKHITLNIIKIKVNFLVPSERSSRQRMKLRSFTCTHWPTSTQ